MATRKRDHQPRLIRVGVASDLLTNSEASTLRLSADNIKDGGVLSERPGSASQTDVVHTTNPGGGEQRGNGWQRQGRYEDKLRRNGRARRVERTQWQGCKRSRLF